MNTIAAGISYQNKNDTKTLSILVNSLEALQDLDYEPLSRSGAGDLISDVVRVADSIVDDERAGVWSSLRDEIATGDNENFQRATTETPSTGFVHVRKAKKTKSPADILFTMESVLGGIVSAQVANEPDGENTAGFAVKFETKNIVGSIQKMDDSLALSRETDGSFVEFDLPQNSSDSGRFAIVSRYPKLMRLISQLDKEQTDHGTTGDGHEKRDKRGLEYITHSPIISASLVQQGQTVSAAVTFAIPFEDEDLPDPIPRDSKVYFSCRFLSESRHQSDIENWDGKGCEVAKVDRVKKLVHCSCNHTTNFAILLQVVPPKIRESDLFNLRIISYVGESISVICLLATLTTFILLRQSLQSARMVAHFHLVIALILFHATQLTTAFAEKTKNDQSEPCVAVAALTHFSLLATFCWMLVEGVLLYISVVSVFHSMKYMNVLRYVIGWVLPGVVSGITAIYGLTRHPYPACYLEVVGKASCQMAADSSDVQPHVQIIEWCWLSSSNWLVWAMVAPAVVTLVVNTAILIRVACVIAETTRSNNMYRPTTERKKEQHIRKCLKGAAVLMPILGVPWLFGLIPQAASHVGMLYVFTILNSMQGFFVFLFYCLLSSEVRSAFGRYVHRRGILHSQNFTSSHASGRQSIADGRSERRRPGEKSGPSSDTDPLANARKTRSVRVPFSCGESQTDQDTLVAECGNNNLQKLTTAL